MEILKFVKAQHALAAPVRVADAGWFVDLISSGGCRYLARHRSVIPEIAASRALDFYRWFYEYRNMETESAIKRLSALAQNGRIDVFRLLVKAGPDGIAAGEIARRLGVPPNTLSAQLLVLSNAQLVRARRHGRSIIYSANFESMHDLLVFLTEDCCGGDAKVCAPLFELAIRPSGSCSPTKEARHEAPARARRR